MNLCCNFAQLASYSFCLFNLGLIRNISCHTSVEKSQGANQGSITPRALQSTIIFVALVTKSNFPNSIEKEGIHLPVIKEDLAEDNGIFDNEVLKLVTMNTHSGIFRHIVGIWALTNLVIQQSVILQEGESCQTLLALPHDVQLSQPSAYDQASWSNPEIFCSVCFLRFYLLTEGKTARE